MNRAAVSLAACTRTWTTSSYRFREKSLADGCASEFSTGIAVIAGVQKSIRCALLHKRSDVPVDVNRDFGTA